MTILMGKLSPAGARRAGRLVEGFAERRLHLGYSLWFPFIVFAITRLVDVALILIAGRHQIALPAGGLPGYHVWQPTPASPGYGLVISNWDGQWYSQIASQGYPTTLPRDAAGHIQPNEWGFFPLYPLLVGAIMRLTGLGFSVVAPTLSCLLGAAAVTVMFRLLSQSLDRFAASATVLLTCTFIAAPAMQLAYSESLALLLLCTALLLLRNRRYGWLVPVVVTLALTRPVALVLVPVVIVHGIARYRRRCVTPFPVRDRWRVLALAGLALVSAGLWPAIAAVRTGNPSAYTQTISAWAGTTGKLRVLVAFPTFAWVHGGLIGLAALSCLIILTAWVVLRSRTAVWGPEVRAWAGLYPLYLLLATGPTSSDLRHLVMAFPLLWPFPEEATSRSERRVRVAVVVVLAICGLLMQWLWISKYLVVSGPPHEQPFP
ncbi:MAG: hypothetical protein QOE58_1396 [Actinomycetota bacterium]|nr:hypothetical protein [Actinomycetota bacterium]